VISGPISISIPCVSPLLCSGGGLPSIGGKVAQAAASGFLDVVVKGLGAAATWMLGHLMAVIVDSPKPTLTSSWFLTREKTMASLMILVLVPLLMAATLGAVVRRDLARLVHIWAVGLPLSAVAGLVAVQLVSLALSATDALSYAIGPASVHSRLSGDHIVTILLGTPAMVQGILFSLLIVATILVWLELLLRASAVYIAVFFMPLALAFYVWPATASVARRSVEVVVALIGSKLVIVAALSLGFAAMVQGTSVDDVLASAGILLMAGFAPFALLKLAPIVEVAAIAHLEGMSRRPFRAVARGATLVAAAPAHPVVKAVMAARNGGQAGGGMSPSSVAVQPLASRRPDYPTAAAGDPQP
jgi:hypothetical protein